MFGKSGYLIKAYDTSTGDHTELKPFFGYGNDEVNTGALNKVQVQPYDNNSFGKYKGRIENIKDLDTGKTITRPTTHRGLSTAGYYTKNNIGKINDFTVSKKHDDTVRDDECGLSDMLRYLASVAKSKMSNVDGESAVDMNSLEDYLFNISNPKGKALPFDVQDKNNGLYLVASKLRDIVSIDDVKGGYTGWRDSPNEIASKRIVPVKRIGIDDKYKTYNTDRFWLNELAVKDNFEPILKLRNQNTFSVQNTQNKILTPKDIREIKVEDDAVVKVADMLVPGFKQRWDSDKSNVKTYLKNSPEFVEADKLIRQLYGVSAFENMHGKKISDDNLISALYKGFSTPGYKWKAFLDDNFNYNNPKNLSDVRFKDILTDFNNAEENYYKTQELLKVLNRRY